MKILVTGSDGQLGMCLRDQLDCKKNEIVFASRKDLDISISANLEMYISNTEPNIIVNAAAYTAVDLAEENKDIAANINHIAVKDLANIASKNNITLIHISTDYVFNGKKNSPYNEDDDCSPINFYGLSKLNGEQSIIESGCKYYIIRTSWVFSEYGNNFVKKMLDIGQNNNDLKIVKDQYGNPTYAQDLAMFINKIIKMNKNNNLIINYSGNISCSWYDFAVKIFHKANKAGIKTPKYIYDIKTKNLNFIASRPMNSVLSNKLAKELFQSDPSDWMQGIDTVIKKYIAHK